MVFFEYFFITFGFSFLLFLVLVFFYFFSCALDKVKEKIKNK